MSQLFSVQDSISKTYLTRHREELHLPTLLIRNHALCNSVAIYLC